MKLSIGFAVAALSGVSSAHSDYDLEHAVMKNLKWIRPPTWEHMPDDMDSFFKEDPKETPEFALKTEKHEVDEPENLVHESHEYHDYSGEYYDPIEDKRYIFPGAHAAAEYSTGYDDYFEHDYGRRHH